MSLKKTCPHCGAVIGAFGSAFQRHQFVEHAAIYDPSSDTVLGCSGPIDRAVVGASMIETLQIKADQKIGQARSQG
ncbi:hypothetical protein ACUN9V_18885 [Salinicola sp. V024]|uniref:hypothetical protein n=1 Tax=Salinicola sp. V024 TaxID=3459609 RepID=UPI004044A820